MRDIRPCIYHDPAYRQRLRESASRGGQVTQQPAYESALPFLQVGDPASLQAIIVGVLAIAQRNRP